MTYELPIALWTAPCECEAAPSPRKVPLQVICNCPEPKSHTALCLVVPTSSVSSATITCWLMAFPFSKFELVSELLPPLFVPTGQLHIQLQTSPRELISPPDFVADAYAIATATKIIPI